MNTKHCMKCDKDLPLKDFGNNKHSYDGKQTYCKSCTNEYMHRRKREKISKDSKYLVPFSDDQLIEELRNRGYEGDIYKIINKQF